jgi:hypothetical protein
MVLSALPKFAGKFFKEADPLIIRDLKERGLLWSSGRVRHSYPFCWRCDTPLLYFAKTSWYIKTTAVRDQLLEQNQRIGWYPEHIRDGRFGDWLRNNVDWAISRERYWGTPLPLWICDGCGDIECIGSIAELSQQVGRTVSTDEAFDLHRPYVDSLSWPCQRCSGRHRRRIRDVIDCWFDSGAMPFAQHHYPFEHKDDFHSCFRRRLSAKASIRPEAGSTRSMRSGCCCAAGRRLKTASCSGTSSTTRAARCPSGWATSSTRGRCWQRRGCRCAALLPVHRFATGAAATVLAGAGAEVAAAVFADAVELLQLLRHLRRGRV